jgi:uncharacterized protein with GYD domain
MPTYVLLSTLTSEGGMTVHQNPDRIAAVNDEIKAFGCKVTAQYALLGQYDFLTVVDAPDNETIAHLSVDLGSRGTTKIMTMPAIPLDKLVEKLKAPEQIGRADHEQSTGVTAVDDRTETATGDTAAPRLAQFID